jgi:signal transduction histidine kinase
VAVTVMLTLFAIFLARWISQALLRSVDLLRADAAALGRGDMPPQKSSGLEETDFVADAMHRAAELLRQRTTDNALLHADLERKVEERTASLREAMTQMEEFSYTVSHDLRSPLRAMQGYAQLLVQDYGAKLDETGVAYLDRIARAAERMNQMTSDLLTYSRLSSSRVKLVPVMLEPVVRQAVEQYIELPRTGAQVRVVAPLAPVMAHEPSLTQALANLLTNAVKFVKPGQPPMITIRTEGVGTKVRIWVEDQGISIAPEQQAGLFRMFERLPTTGKYEGTGIGLAIVKKAAEKMGGTCGVESDGASGSRFWIELAAAT